MVSAAYQMVKGQEVTEIVVPYHVLEEGDTLEGICCRLKDEYGDKRDWREIAFYVCKDNNKKDGWVYLGEKINVRLHVPVETKEKIPKKTAGVYYEANYPRNVEFYVKETKKGKAREKSAKEIEKERRIKEAWFKVDAMAATHYELRKAFMENFKATTKQHELVLMGAYSVAVLQGVTYMGLGSVDKEAGIDSKYFDPKQDEKAVKLVF